MPRVQREVGLVDSTHGANGGNQCDCLRTTVREDDALGIDRQRFRERGSCARWIRVVPDGVRVLGNEGRYVGRARIQAGRQVEHLVRGNAERSREPRAVTAVRTGRRRERHPFRRARRRARTPHPTSTATSRSSTRSASRTARSMSLVTRAAAGAEPRSVLDAPGVLQRAADFEVERGRERRFGDARVRRRVRRCVAAHGTHHGRGPCRAGEADQDHRRACGEIARGIVEARRCPAELLVAVGVVTDHGVHGVDRTVRKRARRAERCAPERWRDHRVDRVLRQRLDDGGGDAGFVETRRVTADERRQHGACTVEVAGIERTLDPARLGAQHAPGGGGPHGCRRRPHGPGCDHADRDTRARVRDPRIPRVAVGPAFHGLHQPPECGDGMRRCRWLPDEPVRDESRRGAERT